MTVIASGVTISSALDVPAGDSAIDVTLLSGGSLVVQSGGSATDTVVSSGGAEVASGGTVYATEVMTGGSETVSAGGIANFIFLDSGGSEFVDAGGTATSTNFNGGGEQLVHSGGVVSADQLFGGTVTVYAGGVTRNTSDYGVEILSGGKASGTTVGPGGVQSVFTGGVASATTVSSGGVAYAVAGGRLDGATIASSGSAVVSSGGVASGATVGSSGVVTAISGGTLEATVVLSGGYTVVSAFGHASGTQVSGGRLYVSSATVSDTTVFKNGAEALYAGGIAVSTTLSGGQQIVLDGGTAKNTTVDDGGVLYVSSGGTADTAVLGSSGALALYADGSAYLTSVLSGAELLVSGGDAWQTHVYGGGIQAVSQGGSASATRILGTNLELARFGIALQATPGDALEEVLGGGTSDLSYVSDGIEYVGPGGVASDTDVASGGLLIDRGSAADATVQSGGALLVYSGGAAYDATLEVGARLVGYDEHLASGTTLTLAPVATLTSGFDIAAGSSTTAMGEVVLAFVSNGARVDVGSDTAAYLDIVLSGGVLSVGAGGSAQWDDVQFGTVYVAAGGSADNEQVLGTIDVSGTTTATYVSGGSEYVFSGGIASTTYVEDGTETVSVGGLAVSGTIEGQQFVHGSSTDTLVYSAGTADVAAGASVSGDTVVSRGLIDVSAGGSAFDTTVEATGQLFVEANGIASGGTVESLGTLVLVGGSVASNVTLLAGADLILSGLSVDGAGPVPAITVAGVAGTTLYSYAAGSSLSGFQGLWNAVAISGGEINVSSGGATSATTLRTGAAETVYSGGAASDTAIGNGDTLALSGGASGFANVVSQGGREIVESGAIAARSLVSAGGQEFVSAGGTEEGAGDSLPNSYALVQSGGELFVAGRLVSGAIDAQGTETIEAGGSAFSSFIFGTEFVADGGTTSAPLVENGGTEVVSSGAVDSNPTIDPGGAITVVSGGVVTNATLDDGAVFAEAGLLVSGAGTTLTLAPITTSTLISGFEQPAIAGFDVPAGGTFANVVETISATVRAGATLAVASGGVALDTTLAGATEVVSSGGTATGFIDFAAGTSELDLYGSSFTTATLSGFAAGDRIDLRSIAPTSTGALPYDSATGALTIAEGGSSYTLFLDSTQDYGGDVFSATDGGGFVEIEVTCFCAGTRIATPLGETAVEALRPGDLVLTVGGEARPVRWLGVQTVASRFADPLRVLPIRIRAGALGGALPARDLLLSPGHAVLLDGLLVQAGALVDGRSVVRETAMPEGFRYYHIELDAHALLFAEGVAAESYVDGVEQVAFENMAERPSRETAKELPYARVKARRQIPTALRDRLALSATEIAGHDARAA